MRTKKPCFFIYISPLCHRSTVLINSDLGLDEPPESGLPEGSGRSTSGIFSLQKIIRTLSQNPKEMASASQSPSATILDQPQPKLPEVVLAGKSAVYAKHCMQCYCNVIVNAEPKTVGDFPSASQMGKTFCTFLRALSGAPRLCKVSEIRLM